LIWHTPPSNEELTSAAVLLRELPGFYEKPKFSRRLVKRLVIFLGKYIVLGIYLRLYEFLTSTCLAHNLQIGFVNLFLAFILKIVPIPRQVKHAKRWHFEHSPPFLTLNSFPQISQIQGIIFVSEHILFFYYEYSMNTER
jgi:hypothetical protein